MSNIKPDRTKSNLDAALVYAGRGWAVFPVPPGTKKSYLKAKRHGGVRWGQTKDAAEITRLWKKYKAAGIGIPTGAGNGIFVVEIDTPKGHGVDGAASLAKLGTLPDTLQAQSPSGSRHFYFKHPGTPDKPVKVFNSAGKLGPGLDVRGDGGMCVAPPTKRKDGVYIWANDLPIADAPDWLLAKVTKRTRTDSATSGKAAGNPFEQYGERVTASTPTAAAAEVLESMGHGRVHASQVKATALLLNDGVPRDDVIEIVLAATEKLDGTDDWNWDIEFDAIEDMTDTWIERLKSEEKQDEQIDDSVWSNDAFDSPELEDMEEDDWQYGHHIMRGEVAGSAAPGGVGKSTLAILEALAMATGRELVEDQKVKEPQRVVLVNLEDNRKRMNKRIKAAMKKYSITKEDLGGRLIVWAKGEVRFCIAKPGKHEGEAKRQDAFINKMLAYLIDNNIDVLSVDPFVRCHQIKENDNVGIAAVVTFFEEMAQRGNCGISLWHHTRKMYVNGSETPTSDSARGASSFVDACRSVRIMQTMTEDEAGKMVDGDNAERRRIFSSYSSKLNYAPPVAEREWYRIESVQKSPGQLGGETVGVAEKWNAPEAKDLTDDQLKQIKELFAGEPKWKEGPTTNNWAGKAIAQVIGPANKAILKEHLDRLLGQKVLRTLLHHRKGFDRSEVLYVVLYDAAPPADVVTLKDHKPWVKLGLSRRTYFRRKDEGTL